MSFHTSKPRIFHVFYSLNISTLFVIFCALVFMSDRNFPVFVRSGFDGSLIWSTCWRSHYLAVVTTSRDPDRSITNKLEFLACFFYRNIFAFIVYILSGQIFVFCADKSVPVQRVQSESSFVIITTRTAQHIRFNYDICSNKTTYFVVLNISLNLCHDFRRFLAHVRAFWL